MESKLEKAKFLFPNMPEYVFNAAIGQFIPDIGWPFQSVNTDTYGTNWHHLIHPFSLKGLSRLSWKLCKFRVDERLLCKATLADLSIVIANQRQDIGAEIGRDCNYCRQSLSWHKKYIESTGDILNPITVAITPDFHIKIIDGHHRVAALLELKLLKQLAIELWVGENTT